MGSESAHQKKVHQATVTLELKKTPKDKTFPNGTRKCTVPRGDDEVRSSLPSALPSLDFDQRYCICLRLLSSLLQKFKCPWQGCHKDFAFPQDLQKHMTTHDIPTIAGMATQYGEVGDDDSDADRVDSSSSSSSSSDNDDHPPGQGGALQPPQPGHDLRYSRCFVPVVCVVPISHRTKLTTSSGTIHRGDDLQDDEELAGLNLTINTTYGFIACTHVDCGIALARESWSAHLKRSHNTKVSAAQQESINAILAAVEEKEIERDHGPVGPVSGLKLHFGHKCDECGAFAGTDNGWRTHKNSKHRGHQVNASPSWAQMKTKNSKFFIVSSFSFLFTQQP